MDVFEALTARNKPRAVSTVTIEIDGFLPIRGIRLDRVQTYVHVLVPRPRVEQQSAAPTMIPMVPPNSLMTPTGDASTVTISPSTVRTHTGHSQDADALTVGSKWEISRSSSMDHHEPPNSPAVEPDLLATAPGFAVTDLKTTEATPVGALSAVASDASALAVATTVTARSAALLRAATEEDKVVPRALQAAERRVKGLPVQEAEEDAAAAVRAVAQTVQMSTLVLCEVAVVGGVKVLTVHSAFAVHNLTAVPLECFGRVVAKGTVTRTVPE